MKLDSYYCLGKLNVMRRARERLLKFESNFNIFSIFTFRKCFLNIKEIQEYDVVEATDFPISFFICKCHVFPQVQKKNHNYV